MEFLICSKHNKIQKAPHKLTTNSFICMNRYCEDSFLNLCAVCKNDHRDHSNKVLTLEDITFLIQRLLNSPFKQLTLYIEDAVSAMKKFKLIQENKKKIEVLQRQIYREVIDLVQFTQSLIHEYALCKKKITELSDMLVNIETPSVFQQFSKNSNKLLSNLQYNFQKDKFEYGNQIIRQKYENRKKALEKTKRKLQELKDYSMKVIEVILANQDSQQQGEQDIVYKKKIYEILKRELEDIYITSISAVHLSTDKETQSNKQINPNKSTQMRQIANSSTFLDQKMKKKPCVLTAKIQPVLSIQKSCQTNSQWIKLMEESTKEYELKIKKIQQSNAKSLNELQNKISLLVKQKQSIKNQFSISEQKQKLRIKQILEIERKLRNIKQKRQEKEKQKQNKFDKLIEIANWKTILDGDRID